MREPPAGNLPVLHNTINMLAGQNYFLLSWKCWYFTILHMNPSVLEGAPPSGSASVPVSPRLQAGPFSFSFELWLRHQLAMARSWGWWDTVDFIHLGGFKSDRVPQVIITVNFLAGFSRTQLYMTSVCAKKLFKPTSPFLLVLKHTTFSCQFYFKIFWTKNIKE